MLSNFFNAQKVVMIRKNGRWLNLHLGAMKSDELYDTILFYDNLFWENRIFSKNLVQRTKIFGTKIFKGGLNFSKKIGLGDQIFQRKN